MLVVAVVEEEEEQGVVVVVVVVVVVANLIHHFAGVGSICCFAAAVPLLPQSDSKLVLPHSAHAMHLVLLHLQV